MRNIENCVANVRAWTLSNHLLINDTKTEFVIIGTRQQVSKIHIDKITVGESAVKPVKVVRNLGAWFDSHLSMNSHIGKVCSRAFRSFYNIRRSGNSFRKKQRRFWCGILSSPHVSITVTHCSMIFHSTNMTVYKGFSMQRRVRTAWSLNSTISLPS